MKPDAAMIGQGAVHQTAESAGEAASGVYQDVAASLSDSAKYPLREAPRAPDPAPFANVVKFDGSR